MKLNKTIKKIIALGAGVSMVGATMMGALATVDLNQYPSPFVENGIFNGLLVVGESAATQDVLGAIDIATGLQYASVTRGKADDVTTTTLEGDAVKIEKSSNKLEFNENVNSIRSTLTDDDLNALADGEINNEFGTFNYIQTIYLPTDAEMLHTVNSDDDSSKAKTYMVLKNDETAYKYKLSFTPALKSNHQNGYLEDIRNKKITILGTQYTILRAQHDTQYDITLTLVGGAITGLLEEGTSKTYTVDSVDYDVKVSYIGDTDKNVKFVVNGEVTDSLSEGDVYRLNDGTELGVVEVLPNEAGELTGGDLVEFNLGADKLEISDTNTENDGDGTVTIGRTDIAALSGDIVTSSDAGTTDGDDVLISSIVIQYKPSQDLFLGKGDKASTKSQEAEDESKVFLGSFDYQFNGLDENVNTERISLKPSGSNNYKLKFINKNGVTYNAEVFANDGGAIKLGRYTGSVMRDLVIDETAEVSDEDTFIVSKDEYSHFMQFKDVAPGTIGDDVGTVKLKDLGSSELIEVTYSGNVGTLNIDGNSFGITLTNDTNDANLKVDFNGDGDYIDTTAPEIYTDYGLKIVLTNSTHMKFITEKDEDNNRDEFNVSMRIYDSKLDTENHGNELIQEQDESDSYVGYTNYGMFVELDEDGQNELEITYPDEQLFGQFYAMTGPVQMTTDIIEGSELGIKSINRIDVGAAVLDTDPAVSGHETEKNLIVVGGPAINKAAAVLLGVPFPSYGVESTVPENAAIIKLVEQTNGNVAVVVAGWTADDSQRASRVLANFADYKEQLQGTEAIVSGTSMTDIVVRTVEFIQTNETNQTG